MPGRTSLLGLEGLHFAIAEQTIREVLPGLKDQNLTFLPTPTPQSPAFEGAYSNTKYPYAIDVPLGWSLEESSEELIAIWDPRSGAIIWVEAEEVNTNKYPTLDSYIADWVPGPNSEWTDFRLVSEGRIRANEQVDAYEFVHTYKENGFPGKMISHWYMSGQYVFLVDAVADQTVWDDVRYSTVKEQLSQALLSFNPR